MTTRTLSMTAAALCACALLTGCAAKTPTQAQFLDWHGNVLPADQDICGIWTQEYLRTLLAPVTYVIDGATITARKQDGATRPFTMCHLTETDPADPITGEQGGVFQLAVGVGLVGPDSLKALPTGDCNQKLTGDYIYPASQGCGNAYWTGADPGLWPLHPTWPSGSAWLRRGDLDVEVDDQRPGPYRDPVTDAITLVN
ncbi:MAG: hypothetical protein FWF75_07250, partial [Propionibacteriaceae bacterium]|nr:hypothetical protein [Propionibacteriaceae bacterium]